MQPLLPTDPDRIGVYRLVGRLGAGGMGVVYRAEAPDRSVVAVKVIHQQLAADPQFRARFGREVEVCRRVAGLCTARVLSSDVTATVPFMVTEFVDGPDLDTHLQQRGPLPAHRLHALATGLAEALLAIHSAGMVHRDLKPSNVLLASTGPKVIDFGIAAVADGTSYTSTGLVMGSPGWMAPEQVMGARLEPAMDVFAWGLVTAFAGTGRHPFGMGTAHAVMYRTLHSEPDLAGLSPEVSGLVRAALVKDPSARPTPARLLRALTGTEQAQPVQAVTQVLDRQWKPAAGAAAAAGAAGAAAPVVAAAGVAVAGAAGAGAAAAGAGARAAASRAAAPAPPLGLAARAPALRPGTPGAPAAPRSAPGRPPSGRPTVLLPQGPAPRTGLPHRGAPGPDPTRAHRDPGARPDPQAEARAVGSRRPDASPAGEPSPGRKTSRRSARGRSVGPGPGLNLWIAVLLVLAALAAGMLVLRPLLTGQDTGGGTSGGGPSGVQASGLAVGPPPASAVTGPTATDPGCLVARKVLTAKAAPTRDDGLPTVQDKLRDLADGLAAAGQQAQHQNVRRLTTAMSANYRHLLQTLEAGTQSPQDALVALSRVAADSARIAKLCGPGADRD